LNIKEFHKKMGEIGDPIGKPDLFQ
jgi:hypothetical protein